MLTITNHTTFLRIKDVRRTFDIYWDDVAGFTKVSDTQVDIVRNGKASPSMPNSFSIQIEFLSIPAVTTADDLIALLTAWKNSAINASIAAEYRTGTETLVAGVGLAVIFKKDGVVSPFSSSDITVDPILGVAISNITVNGMTLTSVDDQTVTYFAILNS